MALIKSATVKVLAKNVTNFDGMAGFGFDETSQDVCAIVNGVVVSALATTTPYVGAPGNTTRAIFDHPTGLTTFILTHQSLGNASGTTYATWEALGESGQTTTVQTSNSIFGGLSTTVTCARGAVIGSDPGDLRDPVTGSMLKPPGISDSNLASSGMYSDGSGTYQAYAHHNNAFLCRYAENGTGLNGGYAYINPPTFVWTPTSTPPFFMAATVVLNFIAAVPTSVQTAAGVWDSGPSHVAGWALTTFGGVGVQSHAVDVLALPVANSPILMRGSGAAQPIHAVSAWRHDNYMMGQDAGGAIYTWWQGRAEGPSRALKYLGTLDFGFTATNAFVGLAADGNHWGLFYGTFSGSDGQGVIAICDKAEHSNPSNATVKNGVYVNQDSLLPSTSSKDAPQQAWAQADSLKVDSW